MSCGCVACLTFGVFLFDWCGDVESMFRYLRNLRWAYNWIFESVFEGNTNPSVFIISI